MQAVCEPSLRGIVPQVKKLRPGGKLTLTRDRPASSTESLWPASHSEEGWKTDEAGLKASHENCGGWSQTLTYLKAYIEHGIDLR